MDLSQRIQILLERFNRPPRPKLAASTAAIQGMTTDQGWEMLVKLGLVPMEFASDRRRSYGENVGGQSIKPSDRPTILKRPSSLSAVLTVAADPEGMVVAENFARELAQRLTAWTAVCNDQVVWYFMERPIDYIPYLGLAYDSARDTVNLTLDENGINSDALLPDKEQVPLPILVRWGLAAWEAWRKAESLNLEIWGPSWPLDHKMFSRFSDLPNPFEPLLDLWSTGYLLYSSFEASDPTIRLYAQTVIAPTT
jgi:hypothetical protein